MSKQVEEYYYLLELLGIEKFTNEEEFKSILKFMANEGALGNLNLIKDLSTIYLDLKKSINKNNFQLSEQSETELNQLTEENLNEVKVLQNPALEKSLMEFFTFNSPGSFYTSRNMRGVLKRFESTYKFQKNMHGELITVNTQDPIYKLLNQILFFVQNELGKTE